MLRQDSAMVPGDLPPNLSQQALPVPALMGRAQIEVSLPTTSPADRPRCSQWVLRRLCTCTKVVVCTSIVVGVSHLVLFAGFVLETERTAPTYAMAGCSTVAGFAGVYLCFRASSTHTRWTAGFLLWTWILGLVQTDGIQNIQFLVGPGREDPRFRLTKLSNDILRPIQEVWLILLSVQRLNSLQSSAEYEFIPNLRRVFWAVGLVYILGQVVGMAVALTMPLPTPMSRGVDFLQDAIFCGFVWLCARILMAYEQVLRHLKEAEAEATGLGERASAAAEAVRRSQRAMRKETWGLMLAFASTFGAYCVARVLINFNRFGELPYILMVVLLGNTLGSWFLSNAHKLPRRARAEVKPSKSKLPTRKAAKRSRTVPQKSDDLDAWHQKVKELSVRGITAQALLQFYQDLGHTMPHYRPQVHTTLDVVRQAIIPATQVRSCAFSCIVSEPRFPDKMVTHSWQNLFRDLVAAVIADAVGENSFEMVAHLLEHDAYILGRLMKQRHTANRVYWICAFAVNQHSAICENHDGDCDSLTGQVHPRCRCRHPKIFSNTPPLLQVNNQSIYCEMNKFDDMMAMVAANKPSFSQVVAVDSRFILFRRAWCVAELVEADSAGLKQHVQVHSRKVLKDNEESLRTLKVEDMAASNAEDVDFILNRISDKRAFNKRLQQLIFDDHGLLSNWHQLDTLHQMHEIGNLLKWIMADGGLGLVWKYWVS